MDTLPQQEFDDVTELASIICGTPVSLITLLDSERQWFKSKIGLDISHTPREHAFCHYAIQSPHEVTIVEDSFQDERFRNNPLATGEPHVRFYAGAPLVTSDGHALGSLCVIDHKPRTLTKEQQRALALLSKRVMERLELRKAYLESEQLFRSSDQRFFALTEQSPDFIAVLNDSLTFTYVNKGHGRQSREELIGKSVLDGLYPEFREGLTRTCKKVLQEGKRLSLQLRLINQGTDEKWVSCRFSPLRDDTGLMTSILVTGTDITEKLKMEAREKESRAYYESLFFNNPSAVALLNTDGTVEDVNESSISVFGHSKEEAVGQNFMNFVDPSFSKEAAEAFREALKGISDRFEGKVLSKEGAIKDVMVTVVPVLVEDVVVKLQIITSDITETKRTQEKVRQQAEALSSIVESINEGLLSLDKEKRVSYLNNVCASLLMKSKEEILHTPLFDNYPNLLSSSLYQKCLEVEKTGEKVHFRETFPLTKKTLDIDVYPTKSGLAIHFLDISAETATREEYEKLYFVASRVKNSVLILDKDETIEWANESFLSLVGYTLDEAQGNKLSQLLGEDNINLGTIDNLREKLSKGAFFSDEVEYVSREGEKFWLHADVTPMLGEDRKVKQCFVILSDYTELKQAQADLQQQANHLFLQNRDLQEFTYMVSHNLRAPVANVLGLSSMLGKLGKNTALFDTSLSHLRTSATKLDTVIRDMNMILSIRDRSEMLEKEQVEFAEVWQQVFQDFEESLRKCEGKVTVDIQEGLCMIGLRAYLYSVFHNLMSNAIKYRSSERSLHIRVKCRSNPNRGTIITIADNGSGFDMDKAGKDIFKLYKRFHTDKEGRGIGLYLVKTHIEAMGGRIEANSQVNVGTSFQIYLGV